jgi:hypothetical protein
MKRNKQKKFDLPERGFKPQIFSNFKISMQKEIMATIKTMSIKGLP